MTQHSTLITCPVFGVHYSLWVGTGDPNPQSYLGYSQDNGAHFQWIGKDSQLFRVVSLLFLDDAVVWGADTLEPEFMRTASWRRSTNRVEVGEQPLPGPVYYACALSPHVGIITVAETELSVWSIDANRHTRKWFEWPAQTEFRGPHPSVRLPRGSAIDSNWAYLNPLRTTEADAAVYRVPTSLLLNWETSVQR